MSTRQQLSSLANFFDRWQRTHSGGFVRAARRFATSRQRIELVQSHAASHPDSALADPGALSRVIQSASEAAANSLTTLNDVMADFQAAVEFLASLAAGWPRVDVLYPLVQAILLAASEEIGLRYSIIAGFRSGSTSLVLQPLLILTSELEEFIAARAVTASPIPGLSPNLESLRKHIRDRPS